MVDPLGKPDNAADAAFRRNPKGTGESTAWRRYSSFIWNNQIALLAPCPATDSPRSHTSHKYEQALRKQRVQHFCHQQQQ